MTIASSQTEIDSSTTERNNPLSDFPVTAPAASPVFYRTYSRKTSSARESWNQVSSRNLKGLSKLGKLNQEELSLLRRMQEEKKALPSGRWLWIGGTPWIEKESNFSGAYNCTSTNLIDWDAFGLMMDLAMMGCGTGAIIEPHLINQLPKIRNKITILSVSEIGKTPVEKIVEKTISTIKGNHIDIKVGDSRRGWVDSYQLLLELSSNPNFPGNEITVSIDLRDIRSAGEYLKCF